MDRFEIKSARQVSVVEDAQICCCAIERIRLERAAPDFSASIIDVGGGESTLVDGLLARNNKNVTVLDVSQTAIDVSRKRLGEAAERVTWLVADITKAELAPRAYDVWHDRAVFHFLTTISERKAYVRQVAHAVKPGGHVIVSTFGRKVQPSAVASTLFATTRSHCTESLACVSTYSTTPKNCIARRLAQSSSFSIVYAGSNRGEGKR